MWRRNVNVGVWPIAVALAVVALAGSALACEGLMNSTAYGPNGEQLNPAMAESSFQPTVQRASHLIGLNVLASDKEKVGTVHNLVFSPRYDRLDYVVVDIGSTGDSGIMSKLMPMDVTTRPDSEHKFVLVPYSVTTRPDSDSISLTVDKDKVLHASSFTPSTVTSLFNANWLADNKSYWHASSGGSGKAHHMTAGKSSASIMSRMLVSVIGLGVRDRRDASLGDLSDVIIDLHEGRPVLGIVSYGGVLGVGEKLAPVPWSAVEFRHGLSFVTVDSSRATLDAIAFASDKWPDLNSSDYVSGVFQKFNENPYWEVFGYVGNSASGTGNSMATDVWQATSSYNKLFDKSKAVAVSGTVDSIGMFRATDKSIPGLLLRVKTDTGVVTVHGGPLPYIMSQNFCFTTGEKVSVTGSSATWDNRSVLLAGNIVAGDRTLKLRDSDGKGLWTIDQLNKFVESCNQACESGASK